MFCKNCGKEISEDTRFCPVCGAEQNGTTVENNASTQEEIIYRCNCRNSCCGHCCRGNCCFNGLKG